MLTNQLPLPPPPLPQDLRERFRGHPEHLAELECALKSVVAQRSMNPDPFERAVWALTDTLEKFAVDARATHRHAAVSGDSAALKGADQELAFMLQSGTALSYDLTSLQRYFKDHSEAFR